MTEQGEAGTHLCVVQTDEAAEGSDNEEITEPLTLSAELCRELRKVTCACEAERREIRLNEDTSQKDSRRVGELQEALVYAKATLLYGRFKISLTRGVVGPIGVNCRAHHDRQEDVGCDHRHEDGNENRVRSSWILALACTGGMCEWVGGERIDRHRAST
jgi:hypothetical protein